MCRASLDGAWVYARARSRRHRVTHDGSISVAADLSGGPKQRRSKRTPRRQKNYLQRARLISAAAKVVEEVGYGDVTVTRVIVRAGVSRKTFYDVFANCEDCMVALFDSAVEQARAAMPARPREPWREGTRTALAQILRLIDQEPGLGRFCLVEVLAGGDQLVKRRTELAAELAELIDRGRGCAPASRKPPPVTAEGVVGAIAYILHKRLYRTPNESVSDLLGPLMSIVVMPYLGDAAARDELARPAPEGKSLPRRGASPGHSLTGLSRLTYRTALVLSVIREHPGSSNQAVGRRAGIADQGQISKLLNRLARNELIENRRRGQRYSVPNAWHLTAHGEAIEHAVRPAFGSPDSDSRPARRKRGPRASTTSR